MIVDYHMHVKSDLYGKQRPEEYIKVAKSKGLDEIGFSDHFSVYPVYYSMKREKLPEYVKIVQVLKNKADITLKLGIEMDYAPKIENQTKKIIDKYPFDYVIGSLHFIDDWEFENPKEIPNYKKWNIYELYQMYFNLLRKLANSKLFNIIGHADIIKKLGFKPQKNINDILKDTIKVFKKNKVCIEVNTTGLKTPCKEIYPSEKFLRICFDYGIPITLGSDAHCPRFVGQNFDKAISLIRKVGYDKIATFKNRKIKLVELG